MSWEVWIMKSRTSFFNTAILKKDITRFAPLWGLYGVFTLLVVLLLWEAHGTAARVANNAPELFAAMVLVNFLYAPASALLLFNDLYQSRMAGALHAMPVRREGLFLTHLSAGLLFCIVPNGIATLLTAALLGQYAWLAALWMAVMVLQFLFFFGVALFAVHCAGNTLGAIAVYFIVNFLSVIAAWLVISFYEPTLYGIDLNFEALAEYSPIVRLFGCNYLENHYDNMKEVTVFDGFLPEDWRYLGISAALGVAFMGAALAIYRKRHLESAGDMISFRPAAPVALVIYALCLGAVLYFIADVDAPALQYIFLFVCLVVGFFTGRMLLERRIKVFHKKNLVGFACFALIFAASLGITALDPTGVTRYVPEQGQIRSVAVCASHSSYDKAYNSVHLTEPEDIQLMLDIHKACLTDRYTAHSETAPLYLRYTLKNGQTVERSYFISANGEAVSTLAEKFSTLEAVLDGVTVDTVLSRLVYLECFDYYEGNPVLAVSTDKAYLDPDDYNDKFGTDPQRLAYLVGDATKDPVLKGLFDAISRDCAEGNMAQEWVFHPHGDRRYGITLHYLGAADKGYLDIGIYEDCTHTLAYLESLNTQ